MFLDGTWLQTLTNIPPAAGNQLYVTINGCTTNYLVPSNATIASIASGLADVLNQPAYVLQSKAQAVACGDRIGLQFTDINTPGAQIPTSVSTAIGSASGLTTFVAASRTNFLDTVAYGFCNFVITNAPQTNDYLQITVTKTNGTEVTLSVTNPPGNTSTPGLIQLLISAINTNASLMTADGLVAEDFIDYTVYQDPPINGGEFNLYARTAGWPASQIQVALSGSARPGYFSRRHPGVGSKRQ